MAAETVNGVFEGEAEMTTELERAAGGYADREAVGK